MLDIHGLTPGNARLVPALLFAPRHFGLLSFIGKAVVRKWREQGCSRQVREGLQWSMILGAARAKRRNPACSQPHLHRRLVRRRHPPRTRRSRSDGGGQGCKTAAWIDIVEVITFISTSYVQVCLAAVFAAAAFRLSTHETA